MDFENRRYRPLDLQRFQIKESFPYMGALVGLLFFALTCLGGNADAAELAARRNKNGPIYPAYAAHVDAGINDFGPVECVSKKKRGGR